MKNTLSDRIVLAVNGFLITVFTLSIVYPFYYIIVLSLNDGRDAEFGGIYFFPRVFTLDNYIMFLNDPFIIRSLTNSVLRTISGVILSLVVTSLFAYATSKKKLFLRKTYIFLAFFTMYFGGGIIPTFVILRYLGLVNNFLVYIVPSCFFVFNAIIFMSFFKNIPASIEESAYVDGANDLQVFYRLIVPISKPVFAAIALFVGVAYWNDWMDTMLYTTDEDLYTLSFLLVRRLKITSSYIQQTKEMTDAQLTGARGMTSQSLLLATTMLTALPIMCVYPFLQKHFVKGIMIGSIKG